MAAFFAWTKMELVKARFERGWLDFLGMGALVFALLLFWIVLFSGVPASFSQHFHQYSLGLFLLILALYSLAFRLPARLRLAVCLGLTMVLFALPLSYLWKSGYSDNFIIGGLLPYKDGKNFYFGANLILQGLPVVGANQATERPLFPGFLASLLFMTGQNLKLSIAVLVQLMAGGLYLATRKVLHSFGALAASCFVTLAYFYIRPWLGYTMSETFGFTAGCLAFALLWPGSQRPRWVDLSLGLAVLLVAVSARAGAFFVFPMLALWMGWIMRGKYRLSVGITSAALAGIVAGYFLVNPIYARILGIPSGSSFGNLSYALYGQIRGGTGWHRAIEELGTRDPAIVYRAAWQYFLEHPVSLLIGIAKSYRDFFLIGEQGIFPFVGQGWQSGFNLILWLGALILSALGLRQLFRDVRSNLSSLLLAGFIGMFLSIPFLPPVDGGTRFYASTAPFFFALPAVGVSWLSKGAQPPPPANGMVQSDSAVLRWISLAVLVLTLGIPTAIHSTKLTPVYDVPVCSSGQVPFVIQSYPGSYIDLVNDEIASCGLLPRVCLSDFNQNNVERSIDDFYQELARLTENSKVEVRIIPAVELLTDEFNYFHISSDKLSNLSLPTPLSGCAVSISTKNQTIFQVESILPEVK